MHQLLSYYITITITIINIKLILIIIIIVILIIQVHLKCFRNKTIKLIKLIKIIKIIKNRNRNIDNNYLVKIHLWII